VSSTLNKAIRIARTPGTALHRALCGLTGCPAGGWGETQQAWRRVAEEVPEGQDVDALVSAVMYVSDATDRYQWRDH